MSMRDHCSDKASGAPTRQGFDRLIRGAKAALIGAMGSREVASVGCFAGKKEALVEGKRQVLPRRRMARKRIAVGSSYVGHSAPARSDKGIQISAHARSEQSGELIGRVAKARRRTLLLHHPGAVAAHEALDHRPAEGADVVGASPSVTRVSDHARLRSERTFADDLQE